jgi:hypothetical protein
MPLTPRPERAAVKCSATEVFCSVATGTQCGSRRRPPLTATYRLQRLDEATNDDEVGTGDVPGPVAGEEDQVGDLMRFDETTGGGGLHRAARDALGVAALRLGHGFGDAVGAEP